MAGTQELEKASNLQRPTDSRLDRQVRDDLDRLIEEGRLDPNWSDFQPARFTPSRFYREITYSITSQSVYLDIIDRLDEEPVNRNLQRITLSGATRRTRVVGPHPRWSNPRGIFQDWDQVRDITLLLARGMSRRSVLPSRIHRYNAEPVLSGTEFFVGFLYDDLGLRDEEITQLTKMSQEQPGPHIHFADLDTEAGPMIGAYLPDRRFFGHDVGDLRTPNPKLGPLYRRHRL